MQVTKLVLPLAATLLSACETLPFLPSTRLNDCLEPNRRVVVEVGGTLVKTPPKPVAAGKPASAPQATPVRLIAGAQGASAFDTGSGVLKPSGRAELDQLLIEIARRKVQVSSVVIAGHSDRLEAQNAPAGLSEERARSVADYLGARGLDRSLMFYEGKGATEPLPATKFCE